MMMESRENLHHDDLLARAVDALLRDPIPGDLPPDRVDELAAAVRQAADQPEPITLLERFENMKPATKIAVAAAAVLAFVGLISWLVPGRGTALAFADVGEALNSVRSATWKTKAVVTMPDGKTVTYTGSAMFLAPSHERTETTVEGATSIQIVDGGKDQSLVLIPATKTAMVINVKNAPPEQGPFGRTFQGLRELVAQAERGKAEKVERLGPTTIDGRPAEGFRIEVGAVDVKIWADPTTLLPVRVEQTAEPAGGTKTRIVMTDFQVNVDLEASLFSLDLPPGYTLQQTMELDASKTPWAYLADALKMAAECNDGVFPPQLQGKEGIDGILQRSAMKLMEKQGVASPADVMKASADLAMKLGAAFGVLYALPPDALHYAGKDVKLGTPDRPILWIKQNKGDRCMVIYADLSVQEIPASEAPQFLEPADGSKP
jgi:outer membrane lipoprotein-sorting protein